VRLSHVNLRQLEYFIAIADAGSISQAAAELHVSQSAIAAALTQLERTLDVQLCVRRRAFGISLTSSGRLLRDRARALLYEAEGLEQSVSGRTEPLIGAVAIGVPDEMAPVFLPPILEVLARDHPLIDVRIEVDLEASFYPRLDSGEIDLSISLDHRLPTLIDFIRLRPVTSWAILPEGHRLAKRERIELADLVDEGWVMLDTEPGATHAASMFNTAGLTPRVAFRSPTFELARSLVGRGFGYTLHIHRPSGDLSWEGRPLAVRPLNTGLPVEFASLAWSRRIAPSPWARAFIEAAREAWPMDAAMAGTASDSAR